MSLVARDAGEPKKRAPWRGLLAGAVAAVLFVFGLAVSAWATRDTPRGVPHEVEPDAGLVRPAARPRADAGVAVADAGVVVDAGAPLIGPTPPPDAGPVIVPGPPVKTADVAALVVPVVEECLKAALRFDPALGGKASVRVVAGHGAAVVTMPVAPSPVLASCIAERGKLVYDAAPSGHVVVDVTLVLDGLRRTVSVDSAELAP